MMRKENSEHGSVKDKTPKQEEAGKAFNWEELIKSVAKNNNYLASILRFIVSPIGFLLIAGWAGYLWYQNRKLKAELQKTNEELKLTKAVVKQLRYDSQEFSGSEAEELKAELPNRHFSNTSRFSRSRAGKSKTIFLD